MLEAVAVDWSGARHPRRRIALARARPLAAATAATAGGGPGPGPGAAAGAELLDVRDGFTREEAIEEVIRLAGAAGGELAVGLDFAFSLPAWFLHERRLSDGPALWALVAEQAEQWLASGEPPWWGRRAGSTRPTLPDHFRRSETQLPPVAGIRAKSPFQVGGAGAVGTASLRGMPHLLRLQRAGFAVWPFDPPRLPVVLEIYPRILTGAVAKRDAAARAAYLRGLPASAPLRAAVAAGEHTFDAAVSAIVMARHAARLAALPLREDVTSRLEGEIWVPPDAGGIVGP